MFLLYQLSAPIYMISCGDLVRFDFIPLHGQDNDCRNILIALGSLSNLKPQNNVMEIHYHLVI